MDGLVYLVMHEGDSGPDPPDLITFWTPPPGRRPNREFWESKKVSKPAKLRDAQPGAPSGELDKCAFGEDPPAQCPYCEWRTINQVLVLFYGALP